MSPKRDKTVSQLVEKYKQDFPGLESRFLRRLIRSEHKEIFQNPSNVRKLTRELKKAFKNVVEPSIAEKPSSEKPSSLQVLKEIAQLNIEGHPSKAFQWLEHFTAALPKTKREKLSPKFTVTKLNWSLGPKGYTTYEDYVLQKQHAQTLVLRLLRDVSDVLNEP